MECHAITGDGTHLLKVRTCNTASLEKLLARIQAWSGVVHTRTQLVLSTAKETSRIKFFLLTNNYITRISPMATADASGAISNVFKLIKDNGATMIDFKFMDLPGQWQHLSVPVKQLEESSFEDGFGFDGSSIRGWKAINESDMLLIPDPTTAFVDLFIQGKDRQPDLRCLRSPDEGEVRALSAEHRPEGRSVPEVDRHRRHRILRCGGGVLHLR